MRRLATAGLVATVTLAVATTSWLLFIPSTGATSGDRTFDAILGIITTMFAGGGWLIVRRTGNRIGLVFLGVGLAGGTIAFTDLVVKGYSVETASPWLPWLALLDKIAAPAAAMVIVILFLLFPTGSLPSHRWRPALGLWVGASVAAFVSMVFAPGPIDVGGPLLENPIGIEGLGDALRVIGTVAGAAMFLVAVLGVVSLFARYRGGDTEVRAQIRWLAFVGAIGVTSFILGGVGGQIADTAWLVFLASVMIGIPAAVAIAVFRYHLYDIDVVVSKTIVYGSLVAFTTLVYVVIAVLAGKVLGVGDRSLPLSIVATALVAVTFQPLRERAQRVANRVVYGKRATPYEVLARFSDRVGGAYATDDVLPRTAHVLADGVHAARATVWLHLGDRFVPAATWPADDAPRDDVGATLDGALPALPGDHVAPVRYRDELLGALAVEKPRDEPITAEEVNLLDDLASQAGLVLANTRMTADLEARLSVIERQAAELRASRQRIVAAQDGERRRLERNIHDGAQQHLVALAVKLRLARGLLSKDVTRARAVLEELRSGLDDALDTLHALSSGIYPPLLEERGIATALYADGARAEADVRVHVDGSGRYPIELEAAVYFSALEALQNAGKYARARTIDVTLAERDGALAFEVRDDGVGFDPSANGAGTGLAGMRDRLAVFGGDAEVRSSPGHGTTVRGRVPLPEGAARL